MKQRILSILVAALTLACEPVPASPPPPAEDGGPGPEDAGAPGPDAGSPLEGGDAGSPPPASDAGAPGLDAGSPEGGDAGAVACARDEDCGGEGICTEEGICAHIAECSGAVPPAMCPVDAPALADRGLCINGKQKFPKLTRLLCSQEDIGLNVYDVTASVRTCEDASACATGEECVRVSRGTTTENRYCGTLALHVEDLFCGFTNLSAELPASNYVLVYLDPTGAPIDIEADVMEVLPLRYNDACD